MAERPNILIFMTDQQQADVVNPDHPCITPHADRLAREGIRFTQTYTPTAHCCPSRASFMTGLYPSRHGVYNNICTPTAINYGLNPGVLTFSELLRQTGYQLAYSGKWHVSVEEGPADRGWDELMVTSKGGVSHHRFSHQWRELAQETEPPQPRLPGHIERPGWGNFKLYGTKPNSGATGYEGSGDDVIVQTAINALPELCQQDDPWMLYIGVNGPHDPFNVPEKFAQMYDPDDIPLPPNYGDDLHDKPAVYQRMRQQLWDQLSEDEVRASIAHYWAYCTMVDEQFGQVLDALEATGQADNTVVLFLSDHGDYCGAHGLYLKGVPAFREAYHVPCIVRWPAGIENPGRAVDDFITIADFAPTFLDLAGVDAPADLTGHSFAPFFAEQTVDDWPDTIFTQFNGVELYYSQRAVVTRDFKYVYNGFDFDELYDLRTDPWEMVNVAADPAYDDVKRELVAAMWRFAAREQDELIFNPYGTVALAPWGPLDGLRQDAPQVNTE